MLSARVNPQSLEERQRQGHDKREDPPAYHAILYGQPGQKRPAEVALEVHEVLPRAGEGMPPVDTRRVGSGRIIASPVSPSPRLGQERRRVDCGRMLLLDCMLRPSKRGSDAVVGVPHTLYVVYGRRPEVRPSPLSSPASSASPIKWVISKVLFVLGSAATPFTEPPSSLRGGRERRNDRTA